MAKSDKAFEAIRKGEQLTRSQQIKLTLQLSVPAIMAQISFILMSYIDTSMVGSLGAHASAAVGLVTSTTWLLFGLVESVVTGFAVMVSHRIGADNSKAARDILRQSISFCLLFGIVITAVSLLISEPLPHWLNGGDDICGDASDYIFIFSLGMPFMQMSYLSSSMLRSEGNLRVPSILNITTCVLDVVFNFFLIYPERTVDLLGCQIVIPGANLGVRGAATGSVLACAVVSFFEMYYLVCRSKLLSVWHEKGSYAPTRKCVVSSLKISLPVGVQRTVMSFAYIVMTSIVAPLGNVAIAADTFAVTIEGICYMPGYGISDAATTLIGQCVGAGRRFLAKSFAYISTFTGMIMLTVMSVFMFVFCPELLSLMTPVSEIVDLGTEILRIEAFAEPMFAAAIIGYGIFVGAGDSLVPSIMNLASMWLIRIPFVMLLASYMGLTGVWLAMAVELFLRGVMFLIRLRSNRWLKQTMKGKK